MRTRNPIVLVAATLAFVSMPPFAGWPMEKPMATVDWVNGYVRGIGSASAKPGGNKTLDRLKAIRAAEVVARRILVETVNGVRVDGERVYGSTVKDSSRVQGFIRGAQIVREEVSWEGDTPVATVELRICLFADSPECRKSSALIDALSTEDRMEPSYVPGVHYGEHPEPAGSGIRPIETQHPEAVSYDSSRPVTGLVLKAEGMRFEREMFPVVVTRDKRGELLSLYSAKSVSPEFIRTQGVARYADTMKQALSNPRIGDNPLVVTVSGVTRENMLIVLVEGAKAIRETTRYGNNYLSEAKVVIAGK